MTQQFKFGDYDSIDRQSTTQLADLLRFDGDLRCSPTCSNQIRL